MTKHSIDCSCARIANCRWLGNCITNKANKNIEISKQHGLDTGMGPSPNSRSRGGASCRSPATGAPYSKVKTFLF